VEVDRTAPLELGHLRVRHPDQPPQLPLLEADQPTQATMNGDGGPPPQLGRQGVPEHLRLGVIAGRAERLSKAQVIGVVAMPAASPVAVRTASALPEGVTGQHQPALRLAGVDLAEAGRGEGHEQPRMLSYRLGDALAALEPGGQELVGVGPVGGRTRRAAGLPPGLALSRRRCGPRPSPGQRARPVRPGGSGGGSSPPGRRAQPTGHNRARPARQPQPAHSAGPRPPGSARSCCVPAAIGPPQPRHPRHWGQ